MIGDMTLSFLDFLAGMLAYNESGFITHADLNAAYDILADDHDSPHLTRQQLYDSIRNSVEDANEDFGFIKEFNHLIDDCKKVLGIRNVRTDASCESDSLSALSSKTPEPIPFQTALQNRL